MENTTTILKNKSENFIKAIKSMVEELKNTNNEIEVQISINESAVIQHNKDIEQLHTDNNELALLREDNRKFIESVEAILLAEAEQ